MNEKQQLERNESYLAADPGNPELLAAVIDLCIATGAYERAAHHLDVALRQFPGNDYFLARRGQLQLAMRQWQEASDLYAGLLARQADINLAYNLAYALQWQGRHADAHAAMAPYLSSPDLSAAMVILVLRGLHHMASLEDAFALIDVQMARCQADPAFLAAASLICLDGERLEQAEQLSKAALALGAQLSPDGQPALEALVTSGALALARADAATAAGVFEQALAQNPGEGRSWSGLGTASLLLRDFAAAQAQLQKAVACLPGHIGSWHLLGWSCLFCNELGAAQAAFQSALELDRNFGESHGGMAVVLARQGERAAAEAAIERAQRLDPQGLSALYAKMILAGQTDDPARFRALAGRLLSTRQGAFGQNLGEMLAKYEAQ